MKPCRPLRNKNHRYPLVSASENAVFKPDRDLMSRREELHFFDDDLNIFEIIAESQDRIENHLIRCRRLGIKSKNEPKFFGFIFF